MLGIRELEPGLGRGVERPGQPEAGASPEAVSKRKASVRAKVEHPFLYIKRHFGYAKVRYRGLSKNTQRLMTLTWRRETLYKCAQNQG